MTAPQITSEELEAIAEAMGFDTSHAWNEERKHLAPPVEAMVVMRNGEIVKTGWNPATSNDDCAAMRAWFGIDTFWIPNFVLCLCGDENKFESNYSDHPDKPAAERYAACKVAAMVALEMIKEKQG